MGKTREKKEKRETYLLLYKSKYDIHQTPDKTRGKEKKKEKQSPHPLSPNPEALFLPPLFPDPGGEELCDPHPGVFSRRSEDPQGGQGQEE